MDNTLGDAAAEVDSVPKMSLFLEAIHLFACIYMCMHLIEDPPWHPRTHSSVCLFEFVTV